MWLRASRIILRNRTLLLVVLALITAFMAFNARKVEMSYEYASLLPKKDSAYIDYQQFLKTFGEEGNLIVVGIHDPNFFKLEKFNAWEQLCQDLSKIEGVENLLSISNSYNLVKDTAARQFRIEPIFPGQLKSQAELDSLARVFQSLPFYKHLLYNPDSSAYLLAITVNKDKMRSKAREKLVMAIQGDCETFAAKENVQLHYSGLPYIRVINSIRIKNEIYMFSALALGLCMLILYLFFRSFKAVFIPISIVLIGVIWALGTMALFGYKITLLTGMIPTLLIVIGIPNSIYMLNKYHHEFKDHGNKIKSLQRVILRIGKATFLTNLTTAAGFGTFIITNSEILKEFGVIASTNIMGLFLLSLILIPIFFSFVPAPDKRHIRHLDNKHIARTIERLVKITVEHRRAIYISAVIVIAVGIYGITLIKTSGYMVDDIPKHDVIYKDLKFFESNFDGLMPLEIIVDTKKPNGVMNLSTFKVMDKLENKLTEYTELSPSLSLLNLLKFAKQSYYNGKEQYYALPNNMEKNFILAYATKGEGNANMLHSFMDSTRQVTRINIRMKDVGTVRMEELYKSFKADVDSIFPAEQYKVTVTGSSVTSFKGNQYLMKNLFSSLALAIFLISLFMAFMFFSWRMVVMSLIPNVIPLIFTAALMGFTGIPIKASTILVFSIAFGISVDNTIHFLAKYRQELKQTGWKIKKSVIHAIRETGVSMMYTFVVLFFGFGIFSLSKFGGTVALGVLVSLTLLVAVMSNLILLPALLIGLEKLTTTKSFSEPMIEVFNVESEFEEITVPESEELTSENIK